MQSFNWRRHSSNMNRTKKQVAAGALSRSEELNLDAQVATNEVNLATTGERTRIWHILQLKQALADSGVTTAGCGDPVTRT